MSIDEEIEADEFVAAAKASPSFERLVEVAMDELVRRFEDEPEKLPGTHLMKLVLDGTKAIRAGDAPSEDVHSDPDVLELIQNKGLPLERRKELAQQEKERLAFRIKQLNDFIYMGEE